MEPLSKSLVTGHIQQRTIHTDIQTYRQFGDLHNPNMQMFEKWEEAQEHASEQQNINQNPTMLPAVCFIRQNAYVSNYYYPVGKTKIISYPTWQLNIKSLNENSSVINNFPDTK